MLRLTENSAEVKYNSFLVFRVLFSYRNAARNSLCELVGILQCSLSFFFYLVFCVVYRQRNVILH